MRSKCLAFIAALVTMTSQAMAQYPAETMRWLQDPAISPDGKRISFTHRGQIFIAPIAGGLAAAVTPGGAYAHASVWSPDSRSLAFASDANGDDDVYLSNLSGQMLRMTFSSAREVPTSFTPDGKQILFTALRPGDARRSVQGALSDKPQLYAVSALHGRENLVLPNLALQAGWNGDGTLLAYSYDPSSDPSDRQHRNIGNARQIWLYDKALQQHRRLFAADGIDRLSPRWSSDGKTIYYLSEASGWLNVWRADLADGREVQLSSFEGLPVRDLSLANDGTIAFSFDGQVHVLAPGSQQPQKISVTTMERPLPQLTNYNTKGNNEFQSSPDGQFFAIVVNGDIFLADRDGNYRQLTNTPGEERDISFSANGVMLTYSALRDNHWGIYAINLSQDNKAGRLGTASYFELPVVIPDGRDKGNDARHPRFSPDGSKLAFWSDRREIKVLDVDSNRITSLFGKNDYNSDYFDKNADFSWSPTSKELLVKWRSVDGSTMNRTAIALADGSLPLRGLDLEIPGLFDAFWSLDGSQIIGYTDLFSLRNGQGFAPDANLELYRYFLSAEARQDFLDLLDADERDEKTDKDAAPPPAKFYLPDFQRSHLLQGRLTVNLDEPSLLVPLPDRRHLLSVVTSKKEVRLNLIALKDGDSREVGRVSIDEGKTIQAIRYVELLDVVDISLNDKILRIPVKDSSDQTSIDLDMILNRNEDKAIPAAFEQAWADVNSRYFDAALIARDWKRIGDKYRAFLPSIAGRRDLQQLLSAMFGELSNSHLFVNAVEPDYLSIGIGSQDDAIGVYVDYDYVGPGRRIAAIVPGGPLDRRKFKIRPGITVITSINGQQVPEAGGLDRLLDSNDGRELVLGLQEKPHVPARFIRIRPIDPDSEQSLMRNRLIDRRRAMVRRLSKNCVAYQYLPAMSNRSFLPLWGTLLSQRATAKAALVDVRSNIGGNLTRELITLLSGRPAFRYGVDGRPMEVGPDNVWLGRSAVLIDTFSYSDASIFPQAFQELKLGRLIGNTIVNTGTSVNTVRSRIMPGLSYDVPVLPYRALDGSKYENRIIRPDIAVPHDPNQLGIDSDAPLEAAIRALMQDIGPETDCRDQPPASP